MPITLDGTLGITTPALTVTGATVNTGGISTAGNLTFTSTGQRIIGDFSNVTPANRVYFQTSTANSATQLGVIPNGTSPACNVLLFNNSDPTNAAVFAVGVPGGIEARLNSTITGTGTFLPLTMYTGGSERLRIDTSGNVGIGTTTTSQRFNVVGGRSRFQANNDLYSLQIEGASGAGQYYIGATNEVSPALVFSNVGGTERVRFASGGAVSILNAAPNANNILTLGGINGVTTANLVTLQGANSITSNLGNCIEWGHSNGAGYRSTFGAWVGSGAPFIGLCCEAGTNSNTFRTRGLVGTLIYNDTGGATVFSTVTNANADNQTPSERMRITSAGDVFVGGTTGAVLGYEKFSSYGTGSFRSASSYALGVWNTANTGLIACYTEGGGTFAGGLTASGASLTLFGGSSVNINSTGANPIVFNTNSSERMRIDASGRVTMPAQPAVELYNQTNVNGTGLFTNWTVAINNGNYYSAGVFTCPVAGIYQVICMLWRNTNTVDYAVRKNGTQIGRVRQSSTNDCGYSMSMLISCAVNDTIDFFVNQNAGNDLYGNTGYSQTLTSAVIRLNN